MRKIACQLVNVCSPKAEQIVDDRPAVLFVGARRIGSGSFVSVLICVTVVGETIGVECVRLISSRALLEFNKYRNILH